MSAVVKYSCSCGNVVPLETMYYCYHCQKIECKFCITEEIDSYFCPNCLDNMASAEAMQNFNRCKKCFECPNCSTILTYSVKGEELYFLSCGYCRWNSLLCDLKSDSVASLASLPITPDPPAEFSASLNLVQKEAKELAMLRDLRSRPKSYRRRILMMNVLAESKEKGNLTKPPLLISELDSILEKKYEQFSLQSHKKAEEEDESLPDYILSGTKPLASQPHRRRLLTRRSKHCRTCDKLVVRPDLNPSKIEFKRLHIAISSVPNIKIGYPPPTNTNEILLQFTNPTHSIVNITFSSPPVLAQHTAVIQSFLSETWITGLPDEGDDEENEQEQQPKDNPNYILSRKENRLLIRVPLSILEMTEAEKNEIENNNNAERRLRFSLGIALKYTPTFGEQSPKFNVEFDVKTPNEFWIKK
eukprot:TRINITY_DN2863_c0_g2_i4.p1 TRINITY_DN2863_c0_g2~~TRINITY_DN2863_c0_g2_i4.p1  ORF type:complete len:416 (-),score=70.52 TRINITY_DN2863_c0_g2_i4:186-1433(-)